MICVKLSKRKGRSLTINLPVMIEVIKATPYIGCWGDSFRWYEPDAIESYWERSKLVYVVKVFLGCQRILDPKGTQTLEGRRSQKK